MTETRNMTLRNLEGTVQMEFLTDRPISDAPPGVCDGLAKIVEGHTYSHAAKPDGQDGDGLQSCPFCAKPLYISSNKVNPSARCITEDCYGAKMPVVNLDDPLWVAAWNTRASPTRDAAEEVLTYDEKVEMLRLADDIAGAEIADFDTAQAQIITRALRIAGELSPATPQPAPDAMRKEISAEDILDADHEIHMASSSAPVPPADGVVTRESIAQELVLYERWTILDETTRAMIHRAISFILNLPPSATGAAERDDSSLLDWLNEQPVDVIYLDDGFLIDVKGNDIRQALKTARDEQASSQPPQSSREG